MRWAGEGMATEKALKKELRRDALTRRDALDPFWRIEASLDMAEEGKARIDFDPGTIVSGFWPMRSEVDVRPLMFALREKGARLCLPAILDKQTMVFRELVRGAPMVDMGFGTAGPGEEADVLDPAILRLSVDCEFVHREARVRIEGLVERNAARERAGVVGL